MESLSGPIKVFYRQNRNKIDKNFHFLEDFFNIVFQKKRVEDPNRVLLYIREADTEVYDALMLESPDLNGLTNARFSIKKSFCGNPSYPLYFCVSDFQKCLHYFDQRVPIV